MDLERISEFRPRSYRDRLFELRARDQVIANESEEQLKLPRIVVKDPVGNSLDTFTTYQEALYRAAWNVKTTKQAKSPEEWRLPNAPLPSRPDFSRVAPLSDRAGYPSTTYRSNFNVNGKSNGSTHENRATKGHHHETHVNDVAFIKESIKHLPNVPSLAFLRHELFGYPKEYVQIVGQILLHERHLHGTDKRDAFYNFPGFCYGCRKNALCYGCERSKEPHYHVDSLRVCDLFHGVDGDREQLLKKWGGQFPEISLQHLRNGSKRLSHDLPWLSDKRTHQEKSDKDVLGLEGRLGNQTDHRDRLGVNSGGHQSSENDPDRMVLYGHLDLDDLSTQDGQTVSGSRGKVSSVNQIGESIDLTSSAVTMDTKDESKSDNRNAMGDINMNEKLNLGSDSSTENSYDLHLSTAEGGKDSSGKTASNRSSRDHSRRSKHTDGTGYEDEEDTSEEDENDDVSSRSTQQKRRRLYRAPPAFKLKQKQRKATKSLSPFSTNRKYDLPTGRGWQPRKSDHKPTQFVEFEHKDIEWKEPSKFELKQTEKHTTTFWTPRIKDSNKKKNRKKKSGPPLSPDSGLESGKVSDSVKEIALPVSDPADNERTTSASSPRNRTPTERAPKREKVKKIKKELVKPPSPIRSYTPRTPTPQKYESKVTTPEPDVAPPTIPELPPIEIPALPQYVEPEKKERQRKTEHRLPIEPMPKLQEAPPLTKKSKPMKIPRSKPMQKSRSPKIAEAPVTPAEITEMKDPLDFLAKYCIISMDRLPFYEKIYNRVVSGQPERYQPPLSPVTGMPTKPVKKSEKKREKHDPPTLHDIVSVTRGMEPFRVGMNLPEQYLEKIRFTIQMCDEKHIHITEQLHLLENKRIEVLAEKARQMKPEIMNVEFKKKKSKKKKKKKKKGNVTDDDEPLVRSKKDITDEVVVRRIDDKMMKQLMKDPELHHIQCEMERYADRLATLEMRIMQMENEKNILDMYCTDLFFTEQLSNERPAEFRRQQSTLYNKLHPVPDIDMNIDEIEGALHVVNSSLLTEREFGYLFQVLNLSGRRKINFQLFSVIAALSEKISQMDPVIKDLINKDDYNALDIKMERSKELFSLLDNEDTAPYGNTLASNLAIELTAGGLTPEHTSYVMSKFNREGKGFVDFLDFVTYVPLFIEIHERIVQNPLSIRLMV